MNASQPILSLLCPRCGEVDLQRDQVWLVLASVADRSRYCFTCPTCREPVRHRAEQAAISVLTKLVAVEELVVPAEALERHDGPALTVDDLIDLMLTPLHIGLPDAGLPDVVPPGPRHSLPLPASAA